MRLSWKLTQRVLSEFRRDPEFRMILRTVRQNAYGKIYLVGGKVYRTLIQEMHGYGVGAHLADWDFFVHGEVKKVSIPPLFVVEDPNYTNLKQNSMRLVRPRRADRYSRRGLFNRACKIDMIGAKDIPEPSNLKAYFSVVPLDVQKIALDFETEELFGPGIEAVRRRIVKVNNSKGSLHNGLPFNLNIEGYISDKARSLRFKWDSPWVHKRPCDCFFNDPKSLADFGCQFPNTHV